LEAFSEKNVIPFDVPGHKRRIDSGPLVEAFGKRALSMDINSMPEMDNLNYPSGVIAEAQAMMADAFGSEYAFFIVNGTTLAVHSMILSACGPGDKILLPRNVHKCVINALILCDAHPVYMQAEISDEYGFATGVTLDTVRRSIDANPDAKAVLLVNPTYYGICSQMKDIVEYAHRKGIAVLVDEAHGAHFGFHDELPGNAIHAGADMAAISVHKTGGSLTQSSAVLLNSSIIGRDHVQAILNVFHTTSASYLLLASLDIARSNLAVNGTRIFTDILRMVRKARRIINAIPGLKAFGKELIGAPGVFDFDETKLVVNVEATGLTGFDVYDILLEEFGIQLELADVYNVLAIISLGDTDAHIDALTAALSEIAHKYTKKRTFIEFPEIPLANPRVMINPREAFYSRKCFRELDSCVGGISAESVMIYPPGIPILAPGEYITKEIIEYIRFLKSHHAKLTDMNDKSLEKLLVVS
jgi:arginine decarboxylase